VILHFPVLHFPTINPSITDTGSSDGLDRTVIINALSFNVIQYILVVDVIKQGRTSIAYIELQLETSNESRALATVPHSARRGISYGNIVYLDFAVLCT